MKYSILERRRNSNPVIIAVFCALISPLSSIVWGIRQRSWSLAFSPFATSFFFLLMIYVNDPSTPIPQDTKYSFQLCSSFIAYEISKQIKRKSNI